MTQNLANYWHENVQPLIDTGTDKRADNGWNWPVFFRWYTVLGNWLFGRCGSLVIGVKSPKGNFVPVGMLMYINEYKLPLWSESGVQATFAWYLTAAPKAFLRKHFTDALPKRLTQLVVDSARTTSFVSDYGGTLWLHAAPQGGSELFDFYKDDCSLGVIPKSVRLKRRKNDGRYFYACEALAKVTSRSMDEYR